jgi:hypothetical protein
MSDHKNRSRSRSRDRKEDTYRSKDTGRGRGREDYYPAVAMSPLAFPDSQTENDINMDPGCESFTTAMNNFNVIFDETKTKQNGDPRRRLDELMNLQGLVQEIENESISSSGTLKTNLNTTTIVNPYDNANTTTHVTTEFTEKDIIYFLKAVNPPIIQRGGKRKRHYALKNNRTMKRSGKLIKGGNISDWLCAHADFVAGAILLSFVGGGFWCLGTYIIPVAMKELRGAVWNYIVKVCETTAVVITNLFKTSGGVSKFIDLIVNSYMGLAVAKQAGTDAFDKIIRPPFCAIRDIIVAWCKASEEDKKAARAVTQVRQSEGPGGPEVPLLPQVVPVVEMIAKAGDASMNRENIVSERVVLNNVLDSIPVDDADAAGGAIIVNLGDLLGVESVPQGILAYLPPLNANPEDGIENDEEMKMDDNEYSIKIKQHADENTGGNILSYLAKKIKKTMKRRKRSHKKYAKKNIHYKSHKKNKR